MKPALIALVLVALISNGACVDRRPRSLDPGGVNAAERAIRDAIDHGLIPGAVLVMGDRDGVRYAKAFGERTVGACDRLEVDDVFDLASVTKPLATSLAVAVLIDRGRLHPDDPVGAYLPTYASHGKESTTIAQLLTHHAGLAPANAMSDYAAGPEEAMRRIDAMTPRAVPGTKSVYSDLGYIVLGRIVERVAGVPLDEFLAAEVYGPLGLRDTGFNPSTGLADRIVATERTPSGLIAGRVHDPRAAALGGVAGHAGLFSTGPELARLCRLLLRGGELDGTRILSEATTEAMLERRTLADGSTARSLMFPLYTVRPEEGDATLRHLGFTGTMVWLDPARGVFAVLLTSRLQVGGASLTGLRATVCAAADEALGNADRLPGVVHTGIDVLAADAFKPLAGRRVGLITNHTGVDRFGRRTIDLLHAAPGVALVAVFSPEHGAAGKLEGDVADAVDEKTRLPIRSLYGETRQPTAAMLADIDTLVFDIQDIGTRFYTYISTMGLAMEAAARHKVRFVVLDRPNPIAPLGATGPIADAHQLDFIAYHTLPVTHGLTIGELARLFNAERSLNCDLHVVAMKNWRRDMWYDATGLAWVDPSPNIRNPTQATLYPAIGLLEAANVSVGRGTDEPFERLGAPYIDGRKLAATLNGMNLPGVRFVPISFTPRESVFAGVECEGVHVMLVDRARFEPTMTGLAIARVLHEGTGGKFESDKVQRMLRSASAQRAWRTADNARAIAETWKPDLTTFADRVKPHRLYE